MIRKILTAPHPALREKAQDVEHFNDELRSLVEDMIDTMDDANGIGLAATQLGILQRVAIVEYQKPKGSDSKDKSFPLTILINPVIIERSDETYVDEEGCLSIPNTYGDVVRSRWIVVRAQDPKGRTYELRAENLYARAIQHELDHLDGILFTDKASNIRQDDHQIPDEQI